MGNKRIYIQENEDDKYKISDFIRLVFSYTKFYLKRWWFIALCMLGLTALAWMYVKYYKPTYTAKAVFMTNSDSGNPLGGIMQLAGRFGFGNNSREVDSEKIVELLGTRQLVLNTLMTEAEIEGKKDILINHYVDMMQKANPKDTLQKLTKKHIDSLSYKENAIATTIFNKIVKSQLKSSASKNGLVNVNFTTPDEEFAAAFLNSLMDHTVNFYVRKKVEQQQFAFNFIRNQVDSLKGRLNSKEYQLSNWYDSKVKELKAGSLKAGEYMSRVDLDREVEILSVAYAEGLKNLELARMNLMSNTPVIQILDRPLVPIQKNVPYMRTFIFYGLVFGAFIAIILLTLYKLIMDAYREIQNNETQ